jgi:hypothetical protein
MKMPRGLIGSQQISAVREPWSGRVELRFGVTRQEGYTVATTVDMVDVPNGAVIAPFLSLQPEAAQMLMDELYASGLRPGQEVNTQGRVAAMQAHIEDLRRLLDWACGMRIREERDGTAS